MTQGVPTSGPAISVVVPCYNEEKVLKELYRRTSLVLQAMRCSYEVILVDDGSKDRTWSVMNELMAGDPRLVLVSLSRNHGHQLALTAGLSLARGDRVLISDADLQDPPELLPEMWRIMDGGADVVYGRRRSREGETGLKLLTAALFYRLIERLTDVPIPRDTGDFRLISRRALDVLQMMPERHRFIRGMISWIGFRQEPVFYDRQARFAGETKYPLRKMCRFAVDAVTAFSTKPLALAGWLGLATGVFAGLLLVYSAVSWARGSVVVGWTSLMATMAIFGSVQMIILGIFGEYLGRLYEQGKGRPLFIIDQIVRSGASSQPDPRNDGFAQAPPQVAGAPPSTADGLQMRPADR